MLPHCSLLLNAKRFKNFEQDPQHPHPLTLPLYRALPCQLRPRPYTLLHAKAHIVARLKLKSINSINQKGYNLMPDLAKALGTGYSGVLGVLGVLVTQQEGTQRSVFTQFQRLVAGSFLSLRFAT